MGTTTPKSTASKKRTTRTKSSRPAPPKFENYQAATKHLFERVNIEKLRPSRVDPDAFKLDRMRALMDALSNPQDALRMVHVAGTNGKGSVVAMLEASLRACNFAVGTYTSPHLTDVRERIQINSHLISYPAFTDVLQRVVDAEATLPESLGNATYFELLTAMGFLHFADQAVDVAIIEVGLGGRLDATNIITPAVSAITQIDLDHTQFLGDTLEKIAAEKAGIFKPGIPALAFKQTPSVLEVFQAKAAETNTPLAIVGKDIDFSYRFEASPQLGKHSRVGMTGQKLSFEHVPVPLPGEHQALNCGLALAVLDRLATGGLALNETKVFEGLAATRAPGRMEIIAERPRVLADGAHNPAGIAALMRSIGAHINYDSMILIFGCAADKDVNEMLSRIALGADKVIFTKSRSNPRACDPDDLCQRFEEAHPKMAQVAHTLEEALDIARRGASRGDLICITGSFYLAGEAKKLLQPRGER
ncbi:MAG: bifunctional folylpolyglutamate synthase/dihydrofolate synthase [Phycisphaerales bacterium]